MNEGELWISWHFRRWLLKSARELYLPSVHSAKAGHPGGSLSAADIFTYLYFEEMNIDPKDPKKDRDRFVLSKNGTHGAGTLLGTGKPRLFSGGGSFDLAPYRILFTGTSGYEAHSGSGYVFRFSGTGTFRSVRHGSGREDETAEITVCMHFAATARSRKGQIWEASMFAGFRKLDNLCVIVDNNNLQIDGPITRSARRTRSTRSSRAFNFHVINIDGNDFDEIKRAFDEARTRRECRPRSLRTP